MDLTNTGELPKERQIIRGSQESMPPEDYTMGWGEELEGQRCSGRVGIGRISFVNNGRHARKIVGIGFAISEAAEEGIEREAFVLPVGGGEDGISGCSGSEVSGSNDIGCNRCGLFGEAA